MQPDRRPSQGASVCLYSPPLLRGAEVWTEGQARSSGIDLPGPNRSRPSGPEPEPTSRARTGADLPGPNRSRPPGPEPEPTSRARTGADPPGPNRNRPPGPEPEPTFRVRTGAAAPPCRRAARPGLADLPAPVCRDTLKRCPDTPSAWRGAIGRGAVSDRPPPGRPPSPPTPLRTGTRGPLWARQFDQRSKSSGLTSGQGALAI
jgi:hypothetical protein